MSSIDKKCIDACIKAASKSPSEKRKVGAIIVGISSGKIYTYGYNHTLDGSPCEINGKTVDTIIHAEQHAINKIYKKRPAELIVPNTNKIDLRGCVMYITHPPCAGCIAAIKEANLEYIVIEQFIKFDTNKLRYDLIPPEAIKALAEVLTYGAKKYKPNNWKQCDDQNRYVAALMRHLEAFRSGEINDSETGLSHIAHLMTNAAFLQYFITNQKENNNG